jgi:hypothetical protein
MGFAPPQFAAELELPPAAEGAEPATLHLAVGGVDEGGTQRFVRTDAASLYLISQESLDSFPRRVVEYRDRRLAEFDAEDARRVELGFHTDSGETVSVRILREDGEWVSTAEPVRHDKLEALVDALSDLRAHDIVAEEFGPTELRAMKLDPPKAVLQVYGDGDPGDRLAEIQLGVAFGDGVTARALDRETIFLLDAAIAEALPADFDDYRARFVEPPEAAADAQSEPVDGS